MEPRVHVAIEFGKRYHLLEKKSPDKLTLVSSKVV